MRPADQDAPTLREQFRGRLHDSLDDFFSLTTGEGAARTRFEAMAIETYDQLAEAGLPPYGFSLDAESAFNFANEREEIQQRVSPELRRQWQAWKGVYRDLLERNPRLALQDLMHWIGETNDFSSWPAGLEPAIAAWIDSGHREPMPFDDRRDIITPDFYERLRRARREAGGFFVYRSETGRTFIPEAEWQREQEAQNSRREEQLHRSREALGRADRLQIRIAKILTLARGAPDFWDAFREWEAERENFRPPASESNDGGGLAGPIAIDARRDLASVAEHDAVPLDPLLADFIERIRTPEDDEIGLTTPLVVAILRGTVRDELGFDGTLVWPEGPSLGEGRP